ncbi:MAG: GIY-YIG nuclease family protein [Prevotellaceae bacterium]|jgi:predicted GIY-YIG superfamily endonuclease|nr:GIY-YIG nuclease family protein [Prevotellaceae bacterium]
METDKSKQYIYIVQASKEDTKCKIGKTNDLEQRLSTYNNTTGKSKENISQYLFTCEVSDMTQVEKDIKTQFSKLREQKSREIYFYNNDLLADYVNFIKSHKLFVKEIFVKEDNNPIIKIVPKTKPSLKERGISQKDVLERAKRVEYDEFYTRYEDVEKEISMYDKEIWKNKTVFCNCDDAVDEKNGKINEKRTSAFALFFINNFKNLGLKKLICTHYANKYDIFLAGKNGLVYVITYEMEKDGKIKVEKQSPENYDGSFDHPLSLKILNEEADIVCTNPPFSRMQDYWKIVIKSGKNFLIIANITNVKNQPYMSYIKTNQVWAGYNRVDWFQNPSRELTEAAGHWYTNFPIENRPKYELLKIIPLKNIPDKFKKYDDSKILMVDNCYIPSNVKKPFAVSVRVILNGILEKGYQLVENKEYVPYINGKRCFGRVLIKKT